MFRGQSPRLNLYPQTRHTNSELAQSVCGHASLVSLTAANRDGLLSFLLAYLNCISDSIRLDFVVIAQIWLRNHPPNSCGVTENAQPHSPDFLTQFLAQLAAKPFVFIGSENDSG